MLAGPETLAATAYATCRACQRSQNAATKRMCVRFTIIASFIFGEACRVREAHGDINAPPIPIKYYRERSDIRMNEGRSLIAIPLVKEDR
jgi:hypothetical protein